MFTIAKYTLIINHRLFSQIDVLLDKDIYVPSIITEFWSMRSYILINIDLGQEFPAVLVMHSFSVLFDKEFL